MPTAVLPRELFSAGQDSSSGCAGLIKTPRCACPLTTLRLLPTPTPQLPYTPYLGHHKELGLNAIYLVATQDCWVKDVAIVNADNGILIEEVS